MDARCARRRQRRRRPTVLPAPRVLDAGSAPAFARQVHAAATGHHRVTVDLRHVVAVDAAGLRVLRTLPAALKGASPTTWLLLALTSGHADDRRTSIPVPKRS